MRNLDAIVTKAGGLQILRCQGIAVGNYSFTPDALTLKPSDFCNVEVNSLDLGFLIVVLLSTFVLSIPDNL